MSCWEEYQKVSSQPIISCLTIGCLMIVVCYLQFYWLSYSHSNESAQTVNFASWKRTEINNTDVTSQRPAVRKCNVGERAAYVEEQCLRHKGSFNYAALLSKQLPLSTRKDIYRKLKVDDKHQIIVCVPAKSGSATFHSLLLQYAGKFVRGRDDPMKLAVHSAQFLRNNNITHLSDYTEDEAIHRLKTYTKIMIIRNPLVRVYSAYREKLATIKPPQCQPYQKGLGAKILKEYRKSLTPEEEKCGYDVTFPEFMAYFANKTTRLTADQHWRQFTRVCHACDVRYDHVLRLETGHSDELAFVNKYLNPENADVTSLYLRNNMGTLDEEVLDSNNYEKVYTEFSGVKSSDFEVVKKVYRDELTLLGYSADLINEGLVTTCRTYINNKTCC